MVSTAVCCLGNIKISIYKTNSIFCCCMGAKLCFHEVKLQSGVPRRIFVPKRIEVMRRRKRLLNEKLHNLYSSPDFTRLIILKRMGRRVMWRTPDKIKRHTPSG